MTRGERLAYVLLTATTLFWSFNYIFVRVFREDAAPVTMAFWRWVVALAILLPFAWRDVAAEWPRVRANWRRLFVLGAFSCGLNSVFAYIGIQQTTVMNASLLNAASPIFIVLLAVPLAGERLGALRLTGMLVSFIGVVCIVARGELGALAAVRPNAGDFFILAACFVWGIYTNLVRRWAGGISPVVALAAMMAAGLATSLPIYAAEALFVRGTHWSWPLAGAILVLGLFGSLLANLFWNRSILALGAGRAAAMANLLPVFSILLAMVFLGERLAAYHVVGAALIFAGIAVVTRAR
jgi:drug/metabolite transporter (DMT)-like permease